MSDISAFGVELRITASNSLPEGITITAFADDADAAAATDQVVAETAMNVNGILVSWSKANPLNFGINLIPGSDEDLVLQAVFEANRPAAGKKSARDIITAVWSYPDGTTATYSKGKLTSGPSANGISNSGRMASHLYNFSFQDRSGN